MMTTTSSTTPKTKPSSSAVEPLIPGARHVVVPNGIVATSWPRIKATCANIGWGFDPWQDAAGRLILAKGANGRWAADLSILSIPRQVGKSYLLGCIIFALCLLNPRLRVIWTSHHTATTEEMFEAMKDLAAHKRVAPHVAKCITLQGSRWRIAFRNGARVDFGARSQGFGRGKARVGVLVLDEFQHITARALANLAPTTNTSDNPLILCAGTPPAPEVSGEAFKLRRKSALEGLSDDTLYVEFSADQGADPDDRKQWAKANPSFPKRTRERAFLLLKKILEPDDFMREALGVWDADTNRPVMPNWPQCATTNESTDVAALGIAVDIDRVWVSLAASSSGDVPHLGSVWRRRLDTDRAFIVSEVARIQGETGCAVMLDRKGPAASLEDDLAEAAVYVTGASLDDYVQACNDLRDAVEAKQVEHGAYTDLDAAVAAAALRPVGDGRDVWARRNGDISMLEAVTFAMFARGLGSPPAIYDL
jgi:hypothetical protein